MKIDTPNLFIRLFLAFVYVFNGCKIYVDIMTVENLTSIYVANMKLAYWLVCSSTISGGHG